MPEQVSNVNASVDSKSDKLTATSPPTTDHADGEPVANATDANDQTTTTNNNNTTTTTTTLMDVSEDSQSSNIVVTPDIVDYGPYAAEDCDNEHLDQETASGPACSPFVHDSQSNCMTDASKLYSAYAAAAAAAAAASFASINSNDVFAQKILDGSMGCRNLLCDSSGVIIAETVYRCLICRSIHDSITEAQLHYLSCHALELGTAVPGESSDLLANLMANSSKSNASNANVVNANNTNLLSQLLRGDQNANNNKLSSSVYLSRALANSSAKSQSISHLRQQMLLKQQQKLKDKNVQMQPCNNKGNQFGQSACISNDGKHLLSHAALDKTFNSTTDQDWLNHLRKSYQSNSNNLSNDCSNNASNAINPNTYSQFNNQLIQSSLADMLQSTCDLPANTNDSHADSTDPKALAMRLKGINKVLNSSVDNSPVSQDDEFNDEDDNEDEQFNDLSPRSDLFEAKSDDSMLDTSQQPPFGYIPELSSLLTAPSKPGTVAKSSSRGGFVTCAVCSITKFYASVQRRYGQFTCMGCAKFFGRFLAKPKKYNCPTLGSCQLNISPRCKACLLLACINTYTIDDKRKAVINEHHPVQKSGAGSQLIGRCIDSSAKRKKVKKMKPM